MDKFVGSSEKNLRELFDNPPPIYDTFRIGETDNGEAISKAALHVISKYSKDAVSVIFGRMIPYSILMYQFWMNLMRSPEREEEMAEKQVLKGMRE
jgi:hypothetical protein